MGLCQIGDINLRDKEVIFPKPPELNDDIHIPKKRKLEKKGKNLKKKAAEQKTEAVKTEPSTPEASSDVMDLNNLNVQGHKDTI